MRRYTREQIETLRMIYPAGTRFELVRMNDPFSPIHPGEKGSVTFIDDMGTIHMAWDNGRTLGLIPGEDVFRKI